MYKLMIVDDEELIRKGIISKISYHGLDFEKIEEASNGKEALKKIGEEQPHVVITDVRMPEMDGIELIRKAKEIAPDIKFIIISGYAEFEYAKQALYLGVNEYLLKPIVDKQLVDGLQKVMGEVYNSINLKHMHQRRQVLEKYCEDLQVEQRLNQILHSVNEEYGLEIDDEFIRAQKIDNGSSYILGLVHLESKEDRQGRYTHKELEESRDAAIAMVQKMNTTARKLVIKNYKDQHQVAVILAHTDVFTLQAEASAFFGRLLSELNKQRSISATAGVSKHGKNLSGELYKQAKEAFYQRLIHGGGKVYDYEKAISPKSMALPKDQLALLEKYMDRSDTSSIQRILKELFPVTESQNRSSVNIIFVWMEIINLLVRKAETIRSSSMQEMDPRLLDIEIFSKFSNLNDIVDFLYSLILSFLKREDVTDFDCKGKISKVINYIEHHFHEELSVNEIAFMHSMSPNYFSTIFRKETGKTVINYITEKRIENACLLLKGTRASVVDIASRVGYQDAQYFFRVFKKITGRTPLEYRKEN